MDERIRRLVDQVKERLQETYGEKIKQVILYGSYVRGDATSDSDVDILIVVAESLNPFEVRKGLSEFLFDILLEEGELISVIAVPEHIFENYNSPFVMNVKREGMKV